jgi:hypothetical protein
MRQNWKRWLLALVASSLSALGPCLAATQENVITGAFQGLTILLVDWAEQQTRPAQ